MNSALIDGATLQLWMAHGPARVGLDTEFLRERTYLAELCLVQVSVAEQAGALDIVGGADLSALAGIAANRAVGKILHAARQDLEVLAPLVGSLRGLFDTQVAAALCGFPAQVGYANLVAELLGVKLDKAHTRTDWSRRPLSAAQLEYALDDVRHLLPLHTELTQRLAQLGREAWFAEEMLELENLPLGAPEPDSAWLRIKGVRGLDEHRQSVARSLAAWREQRAAASNRPRGWILPDAALRELVFKVPRNAGELERLAELPVGIRTNSGERILQLVEQLSLPAQLPPLPLRTRPDTAEQERTQRLAATTRAVAAELRLAPELLATRSDLEALANGATDAPPLRGWRREAIGQRLLQAL